MVNPRWVTVLNVLHNYLKNVADVMPYYVRDV